MLVADDRVLPGEPVADGHRVQLEAVRLVDLHPSILGESLVGATFPSTNFHTQGLSHHAAASVSFPAKRVKTEASMPDLLAYQASVAPGVIEDRALISSLLAAGIPNGAM